MPKQVFYQESAGDVIILNVVYTLDDFRKTHPGDLTDKMLDNPGVWYNFGDDAHDYKGRVLP